MDYKEYNKKLERLMGQLGKEIPGTMAGFNQTHSAALTDQALSSKFKELIALGIAITVRCNGCVSFHVNDSIKHGATREEILETIGVAILMGGGPSVVYGAEALEALNQFQPE